uniref:EGF-like domain-containing protein n=1 Tax=Ciona savignyi TaxID=51511 RepID=H2ZHD4_CIOSA
MNRPSLTCTAGYQLNLDGDGCIDVDECESNSHECSTGSTCINEDGSYRCQDPIFCRPGTRPSENQRSCIDIDECEDPEVHQCGEGAQCVNVPGSFRCTCNRGYRRTLQNGRTHCEEINECALAAGERCTYRCENTPGSYTCVCPNGYNLVRFDGTCKDIDECASGSHNCSESETCFNTRGGFKCVEITCPEHYARLSNKRTPIVKCMRRNCNPSSCPQYMYRHMHFPLPTAYTLHEPQRMLRFRKSAWYDSLHVKIVRGNEAQRFGIISNGTIAFLTWNKPIVGYWSTILYLQVSEVSPRRGGRELKMVVVHIYVSQYNF